MAPLDIYFLPVKVLPATNFPTCRQKDVVFSTPIIQYNFV